MERLNFLSIRSSNVIKPFCPFSSPLPSCISFVLPDEISTHVRPDTRQQSILSPLLTFHDGCRKSFLPPLDGKNSVGMSLQVHLCHVMAGSGVYCLYKRVEKNAKFRKNHSWELVSREIKDIFPSIYQLSETVSPLWTELNNVFVKVGW